VGVAAYLRGRLHYIDSGTAPHDSGAVPHRQTVCEVIIIYEDKLACEAPPPLDKRRLSRSVRECD
jgi:hypothetical protein